MLIKQKDKFKINLIFAEKVDQDRIGIVKIDKTTKNNICLLYTLGVGPCIAIALKGSCKIDGKDQDFIAIYHWSGMTCKELNEYHACGSDEGKEGFLHKLGEATLESILGQIEYKLDVDTDSDSDDSDVSVPITVNKLILIGGEVRQADIRGTELEIKALQNAIYSKKMVVLESLQSDDIICKCYPSKDGYVNVYLSVVGEEHNLVVTYKEVVTKQLTTDHNTLVFSY